MNKICHSCHPNDYFELRNRGFGKLLGMLLLGFLCTVTLFFFFFAHFRILLGLRGGGSLWR